MKINGRLIIFILTFLAVATSVFALSPREELQQMLVQLKEKPYDNDLRKRIIQLAQTLKPAPEIPEEARRAFIIGEALFKQAKSLKPAYQAGGSFGDASNLAPWWGDAYWNEAVAYQTVGQYARAKWALGYYMLTNQKPEERRVAQDRLYAIDADMAIASSASMPGGLAGFWQRSSYQSLSTGEWIKDDPERSDLDVYEYEKTGSTYRIKCLKCDESDPQSKWSVDVVNASADAITFQTRLVTPWYDSGISHYDCKLEGQIQSCTMTDKDGVKFNYRCAKRNQCEIVGGPGITGNYVICK